jgi:nucleotide-binding universal stress UspA family protein
MIHSPRLGRESVVEEVTEIMGAAASTVPLHDKELRGHRILVCLDRSPLSEVCLPYAVSLAKAFGSAITLVHVMQPRHENVGPQTNDALGWEISRQEASVYLERLQAETSQALGEPVETRLEQGRPAARIIDLAREIGSDLTVLSSSGEGGVTALNLGSTVQQVLAGARGSVFIAHPSSGPSNVVSVKRILLPLDGSLRSESVLPTAARMAEAYGAEILLVHVVQEPTPNLVLCSVDDLEIARSLAGRLESSAMRYLEGLRDRLAHEAASVRALVVRHVNERQCLFEISQKERSDLIVLSAHGSACDPSRSFGSVTADLLTRSIVPLFVLQDVPESELQRAGKLGNERAPTRLPSYPPESV